MPSDKSHGRKKIRFTHSRKKIEDEIPHTFLFPPKLEEKHAKCVSQLYLLNKGPLIYPFVPDALFYRIKSAQKEKYWHKRILERESRVRLREQTIEEKRIEIMRKRYPRSVRQLRDMTVSKDGAIVGMVDNKTLDLQPKCKSMCLTPIHCREDRQGNIVKLTCEPTPVFQSRINTASYRESPWSRNKSATSIPSKVFNFRSEVKCDEPQVIDALRFKAFLNSRTNFMSTNLLNRGQSAPTHFNTVSPYQTGNYTSDEDDNNDDNSNDNDSDRVYDDVVPHEETEDDTLQALETKIKDFLKAVTIDNNPTASDDRYNDDDQLNKETNVNIQKFHRFCPDPKRMPAPGKIIVIRNSRHDDFD